MKVLLVLLFIASMASAQVKNVTVFRDTTIQFIVGLDTAINIEVAILDSALIYLNGWRDGYQAGLLEGGNVGVVSRLDSIISQIPRMETADLHTWLTTEEILTVATQIKALLEGSVGSPAVKAPLMTDTQYLTFLNQTPRPRIISAQRISAQWWVYHRP